MSITIHSQKRARLAYRGEIYYKQESSDLLENALHLRSVSLDSNATSQDARQAGCFVAHRRVWCVAHRRVWCVAHRRVWWKFFLGDFHVGLKDIAWK